MPVKDSFRQNRSQIQAYFTKVMEKASKDIHDQSSRLVRHSLLCHQHRFLACRRHTRCRHLLTWCINRRSQMYRPQAHLRTSCRQTYRVCRHPCHQHHRVWVCLCLFPGAILCILCISTITNNRITMTLQVIRRPSFTQRNTQPSRPGPFKHLLLHLLVLKRLFRRWLRCLPTLSLPSPKCSDFSRACRT